MNILLILVDTLRADHLGCYGYPLDTSPQIDALAAEGVIFSNCCAPGVPTTPAHTTIYTGLHPITHNIVSHGGTQDLDRRIPVFPEQLQRAGFTTAAIDNLVHIKPWLARGYEFYVDPSHKHRARLLVTCEEINRRAVTWLEAFGRDPFFLFVHYWEPHTPYLPPERHRQFWRGGDPCNPDIHTMDPIRRSPFWAMWSDTWFRKLGPITDADYIASLYDAEIARADEGVAQLLGALNRLGLSDDTLVVLTADHGESMTEHGIYFDHHGLYDNVIRVPLIMRWPSRLPAGHKVEALVDQTDLAPTLLRCAHAESLPEPAGFDLSSLWEQRSSFSLRDRVVCCENTWQSKWAVRTGRHKLIVSRRPDAYGNPRRELYDLAADPAETTNIAEGSPVANELEEWLEDWIRQALLKSGRHEEPLIVQELTLGKRWEALRSSGATQ